MKQPFTPLEWHPSLAEQCEMARESRGTAKIMTVLGLVCSLIIGWAIASTCFSSAAHQSENQGIRGGAGVRPEAQIAPSPTLVSHDVGITKAGLSDFSSTSSTSNTQLNSNQ